MGFPLTDRFGVRGSRPFVKNTTRFGPKYYLHITYSSRLFVLRWEGPTPVVPGLDCRLTRFWRVQILSVVREDMSGRLVRGPSLSPRLRPVSTILGC